MQYILIFKRGQRMNKKTKTLIKIFKIYNNGNMKPIIIIIISTVISLVSILFLLCAIRSSIYYYGDIDLLKKTYSVEISENEDIEILNSVFNKVDRQPAKVNNLFIYIEQDNLKIEQVNLVFPDRLDYYNQEFMVLKIDRGRFFTKEEIEEGQELIILDEREYQKYYRESNINDIINYKGVDFKLIGIYDSNNGSRAILLYNTLYKSTEKQEAINMNINRIEFMFKEKLDKKTISKMENLFYELSGRTISFGNLLKEVSGSMIPFVIVYTAFIGIILLLFFICLLQLFKMIKIFNQYKYSVLYSIGMKKIYWSISEILSYEICSIISYFISIIIFEYLINIVYYEADLSFLYFVFLFFILQIVIIIIHLYENNKNYNR